MGKPNCLVFPDNGDWIVFAPVSRLALRVNVQAAEQFRTFVDRGRPADGEASGNGSVQTREFRPTYVAIYTNNQCSQQCVYCYGLPSRRSHAQLDLNFCRAAFDFVAREAARQNKVFDVYFTGTGEPTLNWALLTRCVELIREAQQRHSVHTHVGLGTGGQIDATQADWIAKHFDDVNVSLDGPSDIQNLQRPRADGRDSLAGPLRLARTVLDHGRRLQIKCVVTQASVRRMSEIVEFVARQIGPVELEFEMMFPLPWISATRAQSPGAQDFVEEFSRALDTGSRVAVRVRHQAVHLAKLACDPKIVTQDYLCLAPPNIVTAFHDLPQELNFDPQLGKYGWYDSASDRIHFDHAKRRRLYHDFEVASCPGCACWQMCAGYGAVRNRLCSDAQSLESLCQLRIGILQELLRRAVPRQPHIQEQRP